MLESQPSMYCPQCQAEYLPHVLRCSDCDVPLVEHLPVTRGESGHESVSGVAVLKELGPIIALLFVVGGLAILAGVYGEYPFVIQIALLLGHTYFVFLFVFCDTGSRGGGTLKGFSLGDKAVRQKLPLLLRIHAGFLVVMFAGATGAIRLRPHTWFLWHLDPEYFDLVLIVTGVAVVFVQVYISRGILGRALKHDQRSGRS